MNLPRLALLFVAGCTFLLTSSLRAQMPPSWAPDKQFSADEVITTKNGTTINAKIYVDTGKIRTDMDGHGMNVSSIVSLADKKMYMIMNEQKMIMEMPLSDSKAQQIQAATGGGDAKFELVGPDIVNGTACLKYKMTAGNDPKVFYWWISALTHTPVKMAAEDGSFTVVWQNYNAGPQDPSLFQPPAGYQVMQMPAGMSMPGGGGPGTAQ